MTDTIIERYEISGNKLKVATDNRIFEVVFPHTIDMVLKLEKILVVLLLIDDITFNENVYGVSAEGKILWQIEPIDYMQKFSPYGNIKIKGGVLRAYNVRGTDLFLDPETGDVIARKFEWW